MKISSEDGAKYYHSLTVGSSGVYDTITPYNNGLIIIDEYCFGNDNCTYNTVEARLAYAFIYAMDREYIEILRQVVLEHTGSNKIVMVNIAEAATVIDLISNNGRIDATLDIGLLFKDPALLKAFIFDKDSTIETKNDRSNNYRFHLGI